MGSTEEIQIKNKITDEEEEEEEELCGYAMQLSFASVVSMVLKSAIELDIFEIIAKAAPGAHMTPSEIASHLPTNNPEAATMLDRILCLLASCNVLTCTQRTLDDARGVERMYGLAPVCKFFVKNEDGVSIAPLALMNQDKVLMESWYGYSILPIIIDPRDPVLQGVGIAILLCSSFATPLGIFLLFWSWSPVQVARLTKPHFFFQTLPYAP